MKLSKGLTFFTGYVEIMIHGIRPEEVINRGIRAGVYFWDIRRLRPGVIYAKMHSTSFWQMRSLANASNCQVKLVKKHGWPLFRKKMVERQMLMIGAVLFLGVLGYLSTLVLWVNIDGLEGVEQRKLAAILEQVGLKPGISRRELLDKKRMFEREVMLLTSDAIWLGITSRGVVAQVKAVPRKTPLLPQAACDLVAAEDGVITRVAVIRGVAAVEEGATVAQGDRLITGVNWQTDPESGTVIQEEIAASGIVEARVWHEIEIIEPKVVWKAHTRRQQRVTYQLRVGEKVWKLGSWGAPIHGDYFWQRLRKRIYQGRNSSLNVEFIKNVYEEVRWQLVQRAPGEIKRTALAAAAIKQRELENLNFESQREAWSDDGSFVKLIVTLEAIKDIAKVAPR